VIFSARNEKSSLQKVAENTILAADFWGTIQTYFKFGVVGGFTHSFVGADVLDGSFIGRPHRVAPTGKKH
jgi:hypothetical protein